MSDLASSDYPASVLRISGTMLAVVNLRCYMSSITDSSSMRNSSVSVLIHVCCFCRSIYGVCVLCSNDELEEHEMTSWYCQYHEVPGKRSMSIRFCFCFAGPQGTSQANLDSCWDFIQNIVSKKTATRVPCIAFDCRECFSQAALSLPCSFEIVHCR